MPKAKLPLLPALWFLLTTPVVFIDAIYVLRRPAVATMGLPEGGRMPEHPLAHTVPFSYWSLYAQYDRRYAPNTDKFVIAQSYMNLIEVALGLVVLLMALVGAHGPAIKLAIIVAVMTLAKTVLYFVIDHVEDNLYTGHNSLQDQLLMVALPSSFWIFVPAVIIRQCFARLQLRQIGGQGQGASKKNAKNKKQHAS